MATQTTEIDVSRICCSNKFLNLTVYDVRYSKSSVLLCTSHTTQKYFLKDIFEVKILDKNLVTSFAL